MSVVAYDPGQVFGTGLARDLPALMRLAWRVMGSPVGRPLRRFNRHQNTLSEAGHALATLAQPALSPSAEGGYASLRRGRLAWTEPSELARRDEVAQQLWQDSAELVARSS